MLKFRDPQSNIQLAEAELTYKEAVNGEKSLTGTIYSNDEVLHQMERGWSVMFNGDWYYITYVAPTDGGNSITVEFDAVHEFFFKMSKSVAYGTLKDGSHTAKEYLDFVFNGSGYSYTLLSQVDAWEKQSFGDKNRLALFNDLISDMEMEFSIADSGRIMITSEIGQDLSTIVRKGFNLQELNLEYNVSDFVTYAKGFGAFIDKDDESKGRYEAEYTSPLASVYGKLEADPITDERYTKTASLQAALKKAVDSSYSISVGISLEELQNAGYDYESPVPGDYILAVDEQLDFNQRIRIISVEEQYNIYGERISSSVEAGSLSATKQKLDGSESNSVVLALSHATEQADNAVKTANGKNASYSGPNQPQNPREGDMWWYDNGSGTSFMKQYTNGEWVILIDSNTKQNIEKAVDSAIETSHTYTDELNEKQVQTTNALNEKVDKSVKELTDSQQAISSQATAYTDSAVADANAKAVQIGQTTAQNAQKALDEARKDFTSSFASQASQTASMASDANLKASQYASQAKSEAVSAAKSADGVVRTEFKSTTDSMTATIQQNKSDADGKISTAQTTATQALDGLSTKVSQTEYNTKTGQLQTDLTATTQTANQAKTDIVSIKQKDGEQDEKMNSIVSDVNGTKQTVSDLQTIQGKQSGDIATLQSRADGFEATVTKVNNLSVGGRNYILNSSGIDATDNFKPTLIGNKSSVNDASIIYTSESIVIKNKASSSQYGWFYALANNGTILNDSPVTSGQTYTLSLKVRGSASQVALRWGSTIGAYNSGIKFYNISDSWTKIYATFSISKGAKDLFLRIQGAVNNQYLNGFTGSESFEFKEVKFEYGNVSTDWTLALEDLESATAIAQLTADQATISINNYKTDADGRISKAQADIVANANAITQKVSQSDYNAKTGELTQSVSKAQQTADTATQTIGTYKESNDKRVATAETNITANADAIKLTASKTEVDAATGEIKSDISTLEQRADGIEADIKNSNDEIARVKLTADGLSETINDPTTGIATRLLTAEGTITTVQDETNELTSKQTLTANGLTQEIADRKTGDSNTLQAGKDFTTSQITSYDTGMQSRLTQFSDGIMAQVSATNLIVDSSFVNALVNWTVSGDVSWKIDTGNMHEGVRVAKFDNGDTVFDRKTATLTSIPIYTMNLGGTQFYASFDLHAKSFGTSAYFKAEIVQKNSSGTTTKTTAIGGSFDTAMSDWTNYTANITLDPATTQLYWQFTQYGGGVIYVSRPYLGSVQLQKNAYIAGASTDNSSTLKLFNNFFAFGIQANTGALIAGINGDSSGLNIVGEKITITGDTTFIGKNFMDGALIKNASIGEAQIADVSITNAKIASLDVNKISGNVSNFIQSNWNGKYGSTTIDANGMKVDTNGVNTQFGSSGMALNMTGESVGGIGVQGFAGKPSDYQGLTFWLDGNAEYMAWGARNSGATSGNPITKLGWFRNGSNPIGTYPGFNFDDDVIFNKGINVPGATNRKIIFGTKNFQNYNYPYFGDSQAEAGWAFGGSQTYMISGTTYYNATKVIAALNGLGAVKIPSELNSDGTVKTWFNVTL